MLDWKRNSKTKDRALWAALGLSCAAHGLLLLSPWLNPSGVQIPLQTLPKIRAQEGSIEVTLPTSARPLDENLRKEDNILLSKEIAPTSGAPGVQGAALMGSIKPHYPARSRELGEEGIVALRLTISETGTVSNLNVIKSSGYLRLDEAAIHSVKTAQFAPATDMGRPVSAETTLSIRFQLETK